jgi:hypothetical protein
MRFSRPLISAALVAGVLGVAAPATASKYFSEDRPLNAWEDGVSQAQLYGRFFREDLTYLRNNTNTRDPRPGGDPVYEQTNYGWYYVHAVGPDYWSSGGEDQSPRRDSSEWYSQYDHEAFPEHASKGRIRAKVCEDQNWSPDPCSDEPTEVFDI